MSNYRLSNTIHFPFLLSAVFRNIRKQRSFISRELGQQLADAEKSSDGTLDIKDFQKINRYYGLAVPAILGEAICLLRNKPMQVEERKALTYMGAFTGLFDDFFDHHRMEESRLLDFLEKPGSIHPSNSSEKLFLQFFHNALQHWPDKALTLEYFRKVYLAQVESKKQAMPGLSAGEIRQITLDKGGYSVLFYRSVFRHSFRENEEEAFHQIGGLMQFGNDIFDVWKDSIQQINTQVTTAKHIRDIRTAFREWQQNSFDAFSRLNYPVKPTRRFLRMISLCLCSRCYVCLDQLEKSEAGSGGLFEPRLYSRKDLVCDMDLWKNKSRSIGYFLKQ